jgi:hypothetical protein
VDLDVDLGWRRAWRQKDNIFGNPAFGVLIARPKYGLAGFLSSKPVKAFLMLL